MSDLRSREVLHLGSNLDGEIKYGKYTHCAKLRLYNKRIQVERTSAGTFFVTIKTLIKQAGIRRIMLTQFHLSEKTYDAVAEGIALVRTQAIIDATELHRKQTLKDYNE